MEGEDQKMGAEHPTSAIFSRSVRLHRALCSLRSDVKTIEEALLGMESPKNPVGTTETPSPKVPFLEDVKFKFEDHITQVEKIQNTVSTIKASLINEPKIERSG